MIKITGCTWSDIEGFWEDNNTFDKTITPNKLDRSGVMTSNMVYVFSKDKHLIMYEYESNRIFGCVSLRFMNYHGYRVCGLGKFAIDKLYRRQGLSLDLMQASIDYMKLNNFDVSILWASVLRVYDKFGYIPLGDNLNMMIKYFRSVNEDRVFWHDIVNVHGTW